MTCGRCGRGLIDFLRIDRTSLKAATLWFAVTRFYTSRIIDTLIPSTELVTSSEAKCLQLLTCDFRFLPAQKTGT